MHEVYVNEFFIAETPVTYEQWRAVYEWAVENGYGFGNSGQRGSDADYNGLPDTQENSRHPVVHINWYDMVKWCNARSEMEGLTPVYYTSSSKASGDLYRAGRHDVSNDQVRWEANGYRLPTEAEWEKAARGGLHEKRWPWGDEPIDGTRANYGENEIGTTPVGSFPPNGYRIYDMAGNVWEWCWDWWDANWYSKAGATEPDTRGPDWYSKPAATQPDTRGRDWSAFRIVRGGSWRHDPGFCRVAGRDATTPRNSSSTRGFRLARTE